ncbi:zonular occludens toxin domain-containing protein [Acinetobacter sp. SH20PTE14]|uniref:zonular occludens toxin domain-containing protein n=1 Tax=Acinetobacter sp. SH20PTE14 TaxID=2905879 RepID=UPI001F462C75|nr:zonular occludens toxin domain-containing protein [Acinetobacter sp. SH20PTE14]UIJ74336.1 zonular occludens toxin domain-containing protein [Acinetobacter sp. SH20PTE14]UIJ74343.1 zonular occludens toxin domain-containing protein [Acinetobacter sp. SH20PTE14]
MIHLLSATPGSGKSLLATERLLNLSRDNIANLKFNYFYAKAFFEKLEHLKLQHYLDSILVTKGQGLERTSELVFLDSDYFDFLHVEYFINVISNPQTDDIVNNYPPFYFERIAILNLIIDKLNEDEKTKFQAFRPVRTIYTNIADLKLVQCRPLPPDCDWRSTPQGSYFVIDEAQLIPIFSDEARGIDPIVKELTIHRHKGYDFLFITQEPSFVHKYIRKLASLHIHLVNIFGWEQSMMLEWSVVQDSPNAIKSLARAENLSRWRFPKHVYKLYKSTTINTRVKRIPKKLVICAVLAVVFILLAGFMFFNSGNSPLVAVATGNPLTNQENKKDEPKQSKSSDVGANGNSVQQSATNSKQTTNQDSNPVYQADASNAATADVSSTNAHAPVQPSYDPSKPYDFVPVSQPNVVNHRVFSGCVTYQGKTFAVDQQGTKIAGFSASDCKKLLDNSYERPFDYFGQRNQSVQSTERVSTSDSGNINPENTSL